jgi:hypothetical protein
MGTLRKHISYANVIATLALFLALAGGIAWALEKRSVKGVHIAEDAFKSRHIQNAKVKSWDLRDGAVGTAKLGAIAERAGAPQTVPGGTAGDGDAQSRVASARCEPGETALSAGVEWVTDAPTEDEVFIGELRRIAATPTEGQGWTASAGHDLATDEQFRVVAHCLSP